jgi:hypothetical protein
MLLEVGLVCKAKVESYLDSISTDKVGAWKISAFCFIVSLIFSFPALDIFWENISSSQAYFIRLNELIQNPLGDLQTNTFIMTNSHTAKMHYRPFLPVMGYILHINALVIWAIQLLIAPLFYYVVFKTLIIKTTDATVSFLLTLTLALSFPGKVFANDVYGCFDGYPYFFLAVALFVSNNWSKSLFLLFACLCDERSFIGVVAIVLLQFINDKNEIKLKSYFPIFSFFLLFLAIRFFLMVKKGAIMEASYIELNTLLANYSLLPLAILSALDGLWIVFILFFMKTFLEKDWKLFLVLPILLVYIFLSCMLFDVTRSISYAYLLGLVMFIKLYQTEQKDFVRSVAWLGCIASFILPNYLLQGTNPFWLSPIIPKIFKYL